MATHVATARPPFPLKARPQASWREQALVRIGEQRFVLGCLVRDMTGGMPEDAQRAIEDHWEAAAFAASSRWRRGAVARVVGHLDAVDTSLLRIAPDPYVRGQLPGILRRVERFLPEDDLRVDRIRRLATDESCTPLTACERDLVVATFHASGNEERRGLSRLRSFTNMLFGAAGVLALLAIALAVIGWRAPEVLPVCFAPQPAVVCPTGATTPDTDGDSSTTPDAAALDSSMRGLARPGDIALVEALGLLAAALAAAASLRRLRGTSTPFRLPLATALLKLPSGALTAALGLLLMRGEFIPGLSALDTPGQIIAWAVLLGYSQQLLTRMVDVRAQTILDNFGRNPAEQEKAHARVDTALAPA
jgi:hypothetical protein